MILALPTPATLDALSPYRIIECGAGAGTWLRILRDAGIDAIGIDPHPGDPVLLGTHADLHNYADRDLLLVVWPPDQTDVAKWVEAWGGSRVAICGDPMRFNWPELNIEYEERLTPGPKGGSLFQIGGRRPRPHRLGPQPDDGHLHGPKVAE